MSAAVHFSIKYDGPALASHQMDVRELAPALIALSNLLERSNRIAFPNGPEVRVSVKGSFKGGSFGVDLIAIQDIAQQIIDLFAGKEATAVANLLAVLGAIGLIGTGSGSLVALIKWLRGRKPTTISFEGDKTIFELVDDENIEKFEVNPLAGKLYQSRVVRQSLASVIKPLERDGIDLFASGLDGEQQTVISKSDLQAFLAAASEADVVSDTISEGILLQIESAVFKEGNKWRFNDGTFSFFAEILDQDFLGRVNSGAERFGKGDLLVVDLRRVQTISDNGLKTEYQIVKVREHKAPAQVGLV